MSGPQLLYLMRTGKEQAAVAGRSRSALHRLPPSRRHLLWTSFGVGCIALFPQSLVPLVIKTTGNVAAVWFVALYMPSPWQWPVIASMFLLGTASLTLAARIWYGQWRKPPA